MPAACLHQFLRLAHACLHNAFLDDDDVYYFTLKVLVRPPNGTAEPETHFCLEMPQLHIDKFNNMISACAFSDDPFETSMMDPFNATQVAALPTWTTFVPACRDKFDEWIDPTDGWGCCAPTLLDGFRVMDDLSGFPAFIDAVAYASDSGETSTNLRQTALATPCAVPDGGEISGTLTIDNFNGTWYSLYSYRVQKMKTSPPASSI